MEKLNEDVLKFCQQITEEWEKKEKDDRLIFKVGRKYKHTGDYCYTITLDDEDIDYLYQKYSKKLHQELLKNVELMNERYGDAKGKISLKTSKEIVVEMLQKLHTFNQLNNQKVKLIGDVFNVDAEEYCSEYGITYNIVK